MRFLLTLIVSHLILIIFCAPDLKAQKPLHKDVQYYLSAGNLSKSSDIVKSCEQLIQFAEQNYTKKDYNYFNAYLSGGLYLVKVKPMQAIRYLEKAIEIYPHNSSSYSTYIYNDNQFIDAHMGISKAWQAMGLVSTAIQFQEENIGILERVSNAMDCKYYTLTGDLYLSVKDYENAKRCYSMVKKILDKGEPMMITKKNYPGWLKKSQEKSEPFLRDNHTYYYNFNMGNVFLAEAKYDSAVIFMKNNTALNAQFKKQSETLGKLNTFKKIILPDSIKEMSRETEQYNKMMREFGGEDLDLITALYKSGKKEEASRVADSLIEEAHFYHLNGELEKSKQIYDTIYSRLNELEKFTYFNHTARRWKEYFDPIILVLECARSNFEYAMPLSRREIEKDDQNLEESFSYFSESEKREYFDAYVKKLHFYYSLLLSASKKDPGLLTELLDKSLQTKGLILDVSKSQQERFRNMKDTSVLKDLKKVKELREQLLAFNQLSVNRLDTSLHDSIAFCKYEISKAQKKINQKIGTTEKLIKHVNWKMVQSTLKPEEAYVEILKINRDYFMLDQPVAEYWAFFITNSGTPRAVFIGKGKEFEKGIKVYQNRIHYKLEDTVSYNYFWKKIADEIRGKSKIYFNGDGIYHLLNPLTLYNPSSKKYVVNEIQLLQISAGRDMLNNRNNQVQNNPTVLIGNPDFTMKRKSMVTDGKRQNNLAEVLPSKKRPAEVIAVLPGTEKEITTISKIANGKGIPVIIMTQANASEDKVKKISNPSLLHFATHGVFDPYHTSESYLGSKLVLAGAGDEDFFSLDDYSLYEDGFLTAFEVTQMDLSKTGLVVMSACESALGEIQNGEGVWGLQRAFQVAGTQTVLGSLWKINDETTALFMETFYTNYFTTKSVSASYDYAMKVTMEKYPHPYYWGAFVITGK